MAPIVRYRFVDFGTSFTGNPHSRSVDNANDAPATLYANEIATDVGGTCWGINEPLAVIDHHFPRDHQFPSASAAVLHKAGLIRERFGSSHSDVLWFVTHKQPDFDAFCSMYLARWIAENPGDAIDFESYGLHPESWLDLPNRRKLDWFHPDLTAVPASHRWPLLLATYASLLDNSRPVACPRQRALHSILYAALKRGRDYLNPAGGAREFFDEARACLQHDQLNPAFDSVLEHSARFAPELALLDREACAYERDISRARRAVVFLPESEAPTRNFFKSPREVALRVEQRRQIEIDAEHLLLADTFRKPTDGVYLRNPECQLFEEWARLDLENSSRGAGFEFTALAVSNALPDAALNHTEYCFSIDPERANGRHLYTVWSRLQTREVEALRTHPLPESAAAAVHPGSQQRSATLGTLLADPWFGGQNSYGILVRTPHRGTLIAASGVRSDLRDDPVAEAVRTELEGSIYSAESLVAGPQVTVDDLAASRNHRDAPSHRFDLNEPLAIPPPPPDYFRFARVGLRADVPILAEGLERGLALQIGETLWQVLYPDLPGSTPPDFAATHLLANSDDVGVWADRGVAVAQKVLPSDSAHSPADQHAAGLREEFTALASLLREIDQLAADCGPLRVDRAAPSGHPALGDTSPLPELVARAQQLQRQAMQLQQTLTLPGREVLRRFYQAIGVDPLLATVRDLTHTIAAQLDRIEQARQAASAQKQSAFFARIQSKLEWLTVLSVGLLATGGIGFVTHHLALDPAAQRYLLLLGGPACLLVMALLLKPWKRKALEVNKSAAAWPTWILIALALANVVAWLSPLLWP